MKVKKTVLALLLTFTLVCGMIPNTAFADGITVIIDGNPLSFEVPPQNENGRIMIPLRAIFEAMGATIEWDGATQTVTATKGDTVVVLRVGDTSPTVNGQVVTIDQPGLLVDGRTLAPLRFVAEAFGGAVEWDAATQTASISSNGSAAPVTPTPAPQGGETTPVIPQENAIPSARVATDSGQNTIHAGRSGTVTVITENGEVWTWGGGFHQRLTESSYTGETAEQIISVATPQRIERLDNAVSLSYGSGMVYVITNDNNLWFTGTLPGLMQYYRSITLPRIVMNNVVAAYSYEWSGAVAALALRTDGSIWAVGNEFGLMQDWDWDWENMQEWGWDSPLLVQNSEGVIVAENFKEGLITEFNTLRETERTLMTLSSDDSDWQQFLGWPHLWLWPSDEDEVIAENWVLDNVVIVTNSDGSGEGHSPYWLALTEDGSVWVWGGNSHGQLATRGVYVPYYLSPVRVNLSAPVTPTPAPQGGEVEIRLGGAGITNERLAQMVASGEIPANVTHLYLNRNQISDISPLSGLTNLTELWLDENQINDVSPLRGLTNLTELWLSDNPISDISPLRGLTNLTELILGFNQISDISPLSGLTNLTRLDLRYNQISDISPLSGLTNLTFLGLNDNQISDISPLRGLTNLTELSLFNNPITDWSPVDHVERVIGRPY